MFVISTSVWCISTCEILCPAFSTGITSFLSVWFRIRFAQRFARAIGIWKEQSTFTSDRSTIIFFIRFTINNVSWFTWNPDETWIANIITFDFIYSSRCWWQTIKYYIKNFITSSKAFWRFSTFSYRKISLINLRTMDTWWNSLILLMNSVNYLVSAHLTRSVFFF